MNERAPETFRLGDNTILPLRNRIEGADGARNIEPKAMEVLLCLVQQQGQVVTREELAQAVWPRSYSGDDSLSRCVSLLLRQALGDDRSEPRYIETIPKRGYRLIMPASRTDDAAATSAATWRPALRWSVWLVAVLVIGALVLRQVLSPEPADELAVEAAAIPVFSPPERSIAVLPFVNMSDNSSVTYFADGLSDLLLHRFSEMEELLVTARTSSFSFRNRAMDVREIGRALNVSTLLEGSVQYVNGQYRVIAQLIETTHGTHLKSLTFDTRDTDVFKIQDDITLAVMRELQSTLSQDAMGRLLRRMTSDPQARDAYMQGRYHWYIASAESISAAHGHFTRAVQLDPAFALAWVGIADTLLQLPRYENLPDDLFTDHYARLAADAFPQWSEAQRMARASSALEQALALDSGLSEAHSSMAYLQLLQGHSDAATASLSQAILLNANNARAHYLLGKVQAGQERWADALAAFQRALSLDPVSIPVLFWTATYQSQTADWEAGLALFDHIVQLDPEGRSANFRSPSIYSEAALMSEARGRYADAAGWYQRHLELLGDSYPVTAAIASLYAITGDARAARDWLARAEAVPGPRSLADQTPQIITLLYLRDFAAVREALQGEFADEMLVLRALLLLSLPIWEGDYESYTQQVAQLVALAGEELILFNPSALMMGYSNGATYAFALHRSGQAQAAEAMRRKTLAFLAGFESQGWNNTGLHLSRAMLGWDDAAATLRALDAALAAGLTDPAALTLFGIEERLQDNAEYRRVAAAVDARAAQQLARMRAAHAAP